MVWFPTVFNRNTNMNSIVIFLVTVIHCSSALMVRHPPSISKPRFGQIRYVIPFASENTVLKCSDHVGIPSPRYTWKRNGVTLKGDNITQVDELTGDLTIVSFSSREDGDYQCWAQNLWGTSLSHVIRLIAARMVSFNDTSSVKATGREGESFTLPCFNPPEQSPPGTFQWYSIDTKTGRTSQVYEDERIAIDTKGNLHFVYLKQTDGHSDKQYACAVYSKFSEVVYLGSKTQLTVKEKTVVPETSPQLIISTTRVVTLLGELTTLECIFGGNPIPQITWFRNGKPLDINRTTVVRTTKYGRVLEIVNVTERMEGFYTCRAENKLDVAETDVFIDVKSKPIWIMAPKSTTAVEGDDVIFTCRARPAVGEASLAPPQWYINGQHVNSSSADDSKFDFSSDGIYLSIFNVSRDHDIMCVQCIVSNDVGYQFKDAYLNVILPITIISKPRDLIEIKHGQAITLVVMGTTDPSRTLKYEWYYNDRPLDITQPQFFLNRNVNELTFDTSVLNRAEAEDLMGVYVCRVSHDLQTIPVTVNLRLVPLIVKTEPIVTTEPVVIFPTEGSSQVEIIPAGSKLWVVAVVFGVLVLVAAAIVVFFVIRKKNPGKTYLLGKTEVKHHLNPEKELQDHEFKLM
ncbi:neural cell adhesion molecule L1-like [Gigantopelta aegis]|uniref:neural cell adhesion molecule L1-like n=1 Tax=Gigantopelta aegis TaxID=1735272 RepID=UPI001B88C8C3|nr:neural cell adhesion molecule L1-like [Gigantopelta aegis]